jgi:hypothetical protein
VVDEAVELTDPVELGETEEPVEPPVEEVAPPEKVKAKGRGKK